MKLLYSLFGLILYGMYSIVKSYGWSIILFAVFAKVITLPFKIKSTRGTQMMAKLQPEISMIQEKYKNNKEKQASETWKIYEKYNYNPMSSCLPLLLQMPILIGLFGVIRQPETYVFKNMPISQVSMSFLWINDLTKSAMSLAKTLGFVPETFYSMILAVLIVITMYWQIKQNPQTGDAKTQSMMGSTNAIMIMMFGYSSLIVSQGLALYWFATTLLQVIQMKLITKFMPVELEIDTNKYKMEVNQGGKKKKRHSKR